MSNGRHEKRTPTANRLLLSVAGRWLVGQKSFNFEGNASWKRQ